MPQNEGSIENKDISNKLTFISYFWGRRYFIDPMCCSFLHGFAHVSKAGFVYPILYLSYTIFILFYTCPPGDT